MGDDELRRWLHAEVDAALDRIAAEPAGRALRRSEPPARRAPSPGSPIAPTPLQEAQNAQRALTRRVIETLSEVESQAWFAFLIEHTARNALRAGGWRPW